MNKNFYKIKKYKYLNNISIYKHPTIYQNKIIIVLHMNN